MLQSDIKQHAHSGKKYEICATERIFKEDRICCYKVTLKRIWIFTSLTLLRSS